MTAHDLPRHVAIHNEIRARIADIHKLDADEEAVIGSATGESNIEEAIAEVIREAEIAKAAGDAIPGIIAKMKDRQARLYTKRDRCRDLAQWALEEAGLRKITAPDMTITLQLGQPKVIIVEEGSLSAQFVKTVTETKPDLNAIKAAIKAGTVPAGVSVQNAQPVLVVRPR